MPVFNGIVEYAAQLDGVLVRALCPGAEVRLFAQSPVIANGEPTEEGLVHTTKADHAGRYRFEVPGAGAFWLATFCPASGCVSWQIEQVCIGCPAGPPGPPGEQGEAGPRGPAGVDGRDAPCFTRNGEPVDPGGECIELCEACPAPPCQATVAPITDLVMQQVDEVDQPLDIDLTAGVSADPGAVVRIKPDSLDNAVVLSNDGTTARIVSAHSGCEGGFIRQVLCDDGAVAAEAPVRFTMASGSVYYGPLLFDWSILTQAAAGYVAPGGEIAPGWSSDSHYLGRNVYPTNNLDGEKINAIALMEGDFDGTGGTDGSQFVKQIAFPGIPEWGVPASPFWWWLNGSVNDAPYNGLIHTRQPGMYEPSAQYVMQVAGSNAIDPARLFGEEPRLRWRINGVDIGAPFPLPYEVNVDGVDRWLAQSVEFTAPTSGPMRIELFDEATEENGDDAAVFPIGLRRKYTCP